MKPASPYDLQERDFRLIMANGCFDLLHQGHRKLLREAKRLGGKLVVAVNSDESVKRLKGPRRPVQPLGQRIKALEELPEVDYVIPFQDDTPLRLIELLKPDVLVKGGDYKPSQVVGAHLVPEVYIVDLVPGVSTTKLLEAN